MNHSSSSRQTYGILPLSPAIVEALQLEFAMVEAPTPRARFLNFPLADDSPAESAPRSSLRGQRQRAA